MGRARPPSRRVLVTPYPHPRSPRLPHTRRWESQTWSWIPVPDMVLAGGDKQGPPSPLRPGPAPSARGGQVQPPVNGGRDGGMGWQWASSCQGGFWGDEGTSLSLQVICDPAQWSGSGETRTSPQPWMWARGPWDCPTVWRPVCSFVHPLGKCLGTILSLRLLHDWACRTGLCAGPCPKHLT